MTFLRSNPLGVFEGGQPLHDIVTQSTRNTRDK